MQLASTIPAPVSAHDAPAQVPAPAPDPNQPTLPGLEPDVVAHGADSRGALTRPVKVRADRPINAPAFAAFDDALEAARTIMVADRHDARWGLFKRHQGRVEGIALLTAQDGIRLARIDAAIDTYKEPVPGQMFPGQNWTRTGLAVAERATPATLALVGADAFIDLRSGTPGTQQPHFD